LRRKPFRQPSEQLRGWRRKVSCTQRQLRVSQELSVRQPV
jgi:hypothetical protein